MCPILPYNVLVSPLLYLRCCSMEFPTFWSDFISVVSFNMFFCTLRRSWIKPKCFCKNSSGGALSPGHPIQSLACCVSPRSVTVSCVLVCLLRCWLTDRPSDRVICLFNLSSVKFHFLYGFSDTSSFHTVKDGCLSLLSHEWLLLVIS